VGAGISSDGRRLNRRADDIAAGRHQRGRRFDEAETIAWCRQKEFDDLLEDAKAIVRAIIAERNARDRSRLDERWAPYLVSRLRTSRRSISSACCQPKQTPTQFYREHRCVINGPWVNSDIASALSHS
jgi:hypothetical protein